MAQQTTPPAILEEGPVLDGNGDPVQVPPYIVPDAAFRAFMAGRVPAAECPHYMPKSEAELGIKKCERC